MAVRHFKTLAAAVAAVTMTAAGAAAQTDTAYVPFLVNVDAEVTARQGDGAGVSMAVTGGEAKTLAVPLGEQSSVRYAGGAKGRLNAPLITSSRGNILLRLPAQSYKNAEISLYSINGKRIMSGKAAATETASGISRRNAAAGAYVLSVKGVNGSAASARLTHTGGSINISAAFVDESAQPGRRLEKSAEAGDWAIKVSAAGYEDSLYTLNLAKGTYPTQNITLRGGGGTAVPGADFSAKLSWLAGNAESNTAYVVEIGADAPIAPQTLSYSGKTGVAVTLKSAGAARAISPTENGTLFTVNAGVTLILENITLSGGGTNNAALVRINNNGKLIMKDGAKITNNQNRGVILDGGSFVMDGGEITDNFSDASYGGGGVLVYYGTFIMNGGLIARNKYSNTVGGGGGVSVTGDGASFTLNGGKISDNTACWSQSGGGVLIGNSSAFTMTGGEISGNKVIDDRNGGDGIGGDGGEVAYSSKLFTMLGGVIKSNSATDGGGVFINSNGEFEKTAAGGVIYGSNGGADANTAVGGDDRGNAIYVYSYGKYVHRETTVTANERLYFKNNPQTNEGNWIEY
jgi:hypothetical protein